jgi:hypothetical protein
MVILMGMLMGLNLGCSFWMLRLEKYEIAVLNGFAAGFMFMGLLYTLVS